MLTRRLFNLLLPALWSVCLAAGAPLAFASPGDEIYRVDRDWQRGRLVGVVPAAGGGLELAPDQADGWFESAPYTFEPGALVLLNRVAVVSHGMQIVSAWRSGAAADDGVVAWRDWQLLVEATVIDAGLERGAVVLPLPQDAGLVQVALMLRRAAAASPRIQLVTLSELSAPLNGVAPAGLPQRPILNGQTSLTARPQLVGRGTWDGPVAVLPPPQQPQTLRFQPLPWPADGMELAYLRSLRSAELQLVGARDLSLHYIVAPDGTLLEGVAGGPAREALPYRGDGEVVIGVALRDDGPSEAQISTLTRLSAWLCDVYALPDCVAATVPMSERGVTLPDGSVALPVLILPADLPARIAAARVALRLRFAEGTTLGVSQRVSLANPSQQTVTATLRLTAVDGTPVLRRLAVLPRGRADVLLEALVPAAASLPFTVEADGVLAVERTMQVAGELESSRGLTPARRWYFAEAGTQDGRQSYLVLLNPQNGAAEIRLTMIGARGVILEQRMTLAAGERTSLALHDVTLPDGQRPLAETAFSVVISAARPIVAERTRRGDGAATALAGGGGTTQVSERWYFAEGTTENGMREQLILLNPQALSSRVELLLHDERGPALREALTIPPLRRVVIDLASLIGSRGVAVEVRAERAIVAERLMWQTDRPAAALTAGTTTAARQWLFGAARTRAAQVFLIVFNPGATAAQLQLELLGDRDAEALQVLVAARARSVIALHERWPERSSAALLVTSDQPIIVEQTTLPAGIRGGMTVISGLALR